MQIKEELNTSMSLRFPQQLDQHIHFNVMVYMLAILGHLKGITDLQLWKTPGNGKKHVYKKMFLKNAQAEKSNFFAFQLGCHQY